MTEEDQSVWADYLVINHGGISTRNPTNATRLWDVAGMVEPTG